MNPNNNAMLPFQDHVPPVSPPVHSVAESPVAESPVAESPVAENPVTENLVAERVAPQGECAEHPDSNNWHAEAGRKGAHRVHELMKLGLLYEKEHGLKRGRQRVRQLIQEGRLYEQEHGMSSTPRRSRRPGGEQVLQSFLRSLLHMVKPSYRERLAGVLEKLDAA